MPLFSLLFSAEKLFSLIKRKEETTSTTKKVSVRLGLALSTCSPSVLFNIGMQGHAVQLNSVRGL